MTATVHVVADLMIVGFVVLVAALVAAWAGGAWRR